MPRKQLFVAVWACYGDSRVVAMLLSAVSREWGWRQRQGLRRWVETVTGRPRDDAGQGSRAGREAAAAAFPGLQDYSVRHAPRHASLRGEWILGVCGNSSGFGCGSQGLSSVFSRVGRFPHPP